MFYTLSLRLKVKNGDFSKNPVSEYSYNQGDEKPVFCFLG